jgi:hypothetical protein
VSEPTCSGVRLVTGVAPCWLPAVWAVFDQDSPLTEDPPRWSCGRHVGANIDKKHGSMVLPVDKRHSECVPGNACGFCR